MNIQIVGPFQEGYSILKSTPLANPYHYSERYAVDGTNKQILTKEDMAQAYRSWLEISMFIESKQGRSYLTREMDKLAYKLIDGEPITLKQMPTDVHGQVIKDMLLETVTNYLKGIGL